VHIYHYFGCNERGFESRHERWNGESYATLGTKLELYTKLEGCAMEQRSSRFSAAAL